MSELEGALKHYFGYSSFRRGQREVVECVLDQRDMLVLMPTGGGKSLTYQLPALLLPGLTIVVSPLIALMQDQVSRLQANGIAATYINSALSPAECARREQAALQGKLKLVYVAPERLLKNSFLQLLDQIYETIGLSLLAVDEAHCVSEWGHDFRPEYRQLGRLRTRYPRTPMLALTATATEHVRQDILEQLALRTPQVYVASFNRPNLTYEVRRKHKESYKELLQILQEKPGESVIIYCLTRQKVDDVSEALTRDGVSNLPYHAGLSAGVRTQHQERFIRDDVPILVATIAFGMGIAKPDVRAVIHYDMPKNLEGYYQESGRAGRDGLPARCVLFFNYGDRIRAEFVVGHKEDEQQQAIALRQLQQVVVYCESMLCRRQVLLNYFGEQTATETCDSCDNCLRPKVMEDRTADAKKLLLCIHYTRQRFGLKHLVDVLRGANTQKIRDYRHNQLSVYGTGKDLSQDEWKRLGQALLQQGFLQESMDSYHILQLTSRAAEIVRGTQEFQLARFEQPLHRGAEKKQTTAAGSYDEELFQQLRSLRKQLADEAGVPPYVVFPDTALLAMAQQLPQRREEFLRLPGVGQQRLEFYYAPFQAVIEAYRQQHPEQLAGVQDGAISTSSTPRTGMGTGTVRQSSQATLLRQKIVGLASQGLDVHEIAQACARQPSTIVEYLCDALHAGEEIAVDQFVPSERYQVITESLQRVGHEQLKPVKMDLGDDYSYEEIRIVRAHLLARR